MKSNSSLTTYEICVKGHLDERWQRLFGDLEFFLRPDGETVMRGTIDQAALHGILNHIRDVGLTLVSVQSYVSSQSSSTKGNPS